MFLRMFKGHYRSSNLIVLVILVASLPTLVYAPERPFIFGCGRYYASWAGRPWSYDENCWDHMVNIGATITGTGLCWSDAEPVQGQYNWDAIYYTDFCVDEILARGLEPTFFVGLTPQWAALYPDLPPHRTPPAEEYVEEFMDFHRFVANRYKGKVKYYLFWNEPNGCSWINDNCNNSDSYPLYTLWLIRVSQAIKEVDPNAKIIAGNLDYNIGVPNGWEYVQGMYDCGAGPYIDGIAIHPYDWIGTINWDAILDTRAVMVANGDEDKGIWLTEYGWNTTDYQETADKLTSVLTELKKPEWHFVEMASYLVLNDGPGVENYGLMDADLNPRPGYYAFQDMDKTFPDASSPTMVNPSFEDNGGSLSGWHIQVISDEGPDIPPLDNNNPYGPQTPFGEHFAGKVTNWLKMNFRLGQIIEVPDYDADSMKVNWALSAYVHLHCHHYEQSLPENIHQDWEIGWNDDGSLPADINSCDNYITIASINGNYTDNDRVNFYPLSVNGNITDVNNLRYVVFRIHFYNDTAVEWSMSNIDNVNFRILSPDFNKDGEVDLADFAILASAWATTPTDTNWNVNCDISIPVDNVIGTLDLAAFTDHWLRGAQ